MNTRMCEKCYNSIEFLLTVPVKKIWGVNVYSASVYSKNMQKLIRGVKYHRQKELAFFQAKIMFDYWQRLECSNENFLIVPVPMHKKRVKKRKYNHMQLVADEFSKLTGYEVATDLITREKETQPQYRLTIKERENNLSGAFKVDKTLYNGEKLLIIDDILTTGSTIKEMIKSFQDVGVYNITGFTTSCTEANMIHQKSCI